MTDAKFVLSAKQSTAWWDILQNPAYRRILMDGGARSTKTMLICLWLCQQALTTPDARILIARKNRNAAKKSIWNDTLRKILRGYPGVRFMEGELEVHFRNGAQIHVDGLDTQDRVDKILGREYLHVFFNEATQLTWATVQTVLSRLAQNLPGTTRKAIFDCNPKSQRHWLYKVGVQHVDPDTGKPLTDSATWARQHWTPYDNPFLPADALATLEALTGTQRRRLLKGEWCESEGAVYDEFDEDVHVFHGDMPPGSDDWRRRRVVDFGYTNPFVCLWAALDPDGRIWIYRERYVRSQTVQVHARAILAAEDISCRTVADHDAEDRATLATEGIPTVSARKDIARGIQAVKERLKVQGDGKPRLLIHESCRETLSEVYDYVWDKPPDGKNEKEIPVKDRDHSMDAIRYLVMDEDHVGRASIADPRFMES